MALNPIAPVPFPSMSRWRIMNYSNAYGMGLSTSTRTRPNSTIATQVLVRCVESQTLVLIERYVARLFRRFGTAMPNVSRNGLLCHQRFSINFGKPCRSCFASHGIGGALSNSATVLQAGLLPGPLQSVDRGELFAAVQTICWAQHHGRFPCIRTDSQYVHDGLLNWLEWVRDQDLWSMVADLLACFDTPVLTPYL